MKFVFDKNTVCVVDTERLIEFLVFDMRGVRDDNYLLSIRPLTRGRYVEIRQIPINRPLKDDHGRWVKRALLSLIREYGG